MKKRYIDTWFRKNGKKGVSDFNERKIFASMRILAFILLLEQNIIYEDNEDITEKKEVEKTGFSSE